MTDLNTYGNYAITDIVSGTYDLAFKASHWLKRVVPHILVDKDLTGIDATLINGDVDEDNEVNSTDLSILGLALTSTPEDDNWNPSADLDGDLEINSTDLSILGLALGLSGDE